MGQAGIPFDSNKKATIIKIDVDRILKESGIAKISISDLDNGQARSGWSQSHRAWNRH